MREVYLKMNVLSIQFYESKGEKHKMLRNRRAGDWARSRQNLQSTSSAGDQLVNRYLGMVRGGDGRSLREPWRETFSWSCLAHRLSCPRRVFSCCVGLFLADYGECLLSTFFDDDTFYTMSNYRNLRVDNLYYLVSALADLFFTHLPCSICSHLPLFTDFCQWRRSLYS